MANHSAKIDVWNKPDKFGWTPRAIEVGYRLGNFKPSPDTEASSREVMIAAGVTPPKVVVAKTQQIYGISTALVERSVSSRRRSG